MYAKLLNFYLMSKPFLSFLVRHFKWYKRYTVPNFAGLAIVNFSSGGSPYGQPSAVMDNNACIRLLWLLI